MHRPRKVAAHQFDLEPVGPGGWRLCDRTMAESDPGSVLAYVERLPIGGYEIVWVQGGRGITRHASIDEIFRVAALRLQVPVISPGRKPAPIPHVPPLSIA